MQHRKMGGTTVAVIGNGFPGCGQHHTEYHGVWTDEFNHRHGVNCGEIAAFYGRAWQADFLFDEVPPRGAC